MYPVNNVHVSNGQVESNMPCQYFKSWGLIKKETNMKGSRKRQIFRRIINKNKVWEVKYQKIER